MKTIFDKLDEYSLLQENWDGYGCDKPNLKIIENARKFISELMKNVNIVPKTMISSYGAVGFYFQLDKKYIEIEVESKSYSYFIYYNNSELSGKDGLKLEEMDADLISAIKLMYTERLKLSDLIGYQLITTPTSTIFKIKIPEECRIKQIYTNTKEQK